MKQIIAIICICALNASAQNMKDDKVPTAVKKAFVEKYPEAGKVEWEKEKANYEAEWNVKRVNMENGKPVKRSIEKSVVFDETGKLIQTEEEIEVSSLPASVSDYAKSKLNGKKISEACKISLANGSIQYEAEIGKDDYLFDANGNFIEKKQDKNNDQ